MNLSKPFWSSGLDFPLLMMTGLIILFLNFLVFIDKDKGGIIMRKKLPINSLTIIYSVIVNIISMEQVQFSRITY